MRFGRAVRFVLLGCLAWASSPATQAWASEDCWLQHRATVYEWMCAHRHLPASGREFALGVLVVDSPKAVMVVDSGATAVVGEALARDVRQRFGAKPLWILNTQPKPEHVLGNIGFRDVFRDTLKPEESFAQRIVAGKLTSDLMAKRCPECISKFAQRMGAAQVAGTLPVVPLRILRAESGHLGALNPDWVGWKYRLHKNIETEEALVLNNRELNIRWVGSAVQDRAVPDLYDGDVVARIDFLHRLLVRGRAEETLMTSFGVLGRDAVKRNLDYFVDLHRSVLVGLEQGVSEVELIRQLSEPLQNAQPSQGQGVYLDPDAAQARARALETHQLNIQRVYRQTEPLVF
ncbi:hypothetical protein [Limnobacter sp.]|uniref:hypothetical protein n=1 Tax=Limnobacter sp. TaxID=2003368 RepID=UPI0035190978